MCVCLCVLWNRWVKILKTFWKIGFLSVNALSFERRMEWIWNGLMKSLMNFRYFCLIKDIELHVNVHRMSSELTLCVYGAQRGEHLSLSSWQLRAACYYFWSVREYKKGGSEMLLFFISCICCSCLVHGMKLKSCIWKEIYLRSSWQLGRQSSSYY